MVAWLNGFETVLTLHVINLYRQKPQQFYSLVAQLEKLRTPEYRLLPPNYTKLH